MLRSLEEHRFPCYGQARSLLLLFRLPSKRTKGSHDGDVLCQWKTETAYGDSSQITFAPQGRETSEDLLPAAFVDNLILWYSTPQVNRYVALHPW